MVRERQKRLARLLKLMRQMKRMEEWQVQRLDEEIRQAVEKRRELLAAMENDIFRSRMMADLVARSLRQAATMETEARAAQDKARERLAERHRQARQVARMEIRTRQALSRQAERDALLEAIERAVRPKGDGL